MDAFPMDYYMASTELYKQEIHDFFLFLTIFFFNLKLNYFIIKFVDEQSLVNAWNLLKYRF